MNMNFLFAKPIRETRDIESDFVVFSPEAAYQLGQKNMAYRIPEDFLADTSLFADERVYFGEQLKWFEMFDDFLGRHISLCRDAGIPLALSCFLRLKYLMDSIIIHARVFDSILTAEKPDEVHCVAISFGCFDRSVFKFHVFLQPVLTEVLETLAKIRGIPFFLENSPAPVPQEPKWENRFSSVSRAVSPFLKNFYCFFKYAKPVVRPLTNPLKGEDSFLVLHAGVPETDIFIKNLVREKGKEIYVFEKGFLADEKKFLRNKVPAFCHDQAEAKIKGECLAASENLTDVHPLVRWPNRYLSFDISRTIGPFLRYFAERECFQVLSQALRVRPALESKRIKYIFARGNTDIDSLSILLAGKYLTRTKTVCVQHASSGLAGESMSVYDANTYDVVISRDSVSKRYFLDRPRSATSYLCSSHYLEHISKIFIRRKKEASTSKSVLYVEKKFFERLRGFNENMYALSEYFEFQKAVVDLFDVLSRRDGWRFIYKHARGQSWAEGSILPYIRKKNNPLLKVEDRHLLKVLGSTDRVIVDYPSGALFEAAAAGKALLCVYPAYFRINPVAREIFGNSFQPFGDITEAVSAIENFMASDSARFSVNLPIAFDRKEFSRLFGFDLSRN